MTLRPNFQANVGGSQVQILSSFPADHVDAVQVSTLDAVLSQFASLLAKYPLTLVKIDIEGMECEALRALTTSSHTTARILSSSLPLKTRAR